MVRAPKKKPAWPSTLGCLITPAYSSTGLSPPASCPSF